MNQPFPFENADIPTYAPGSESRNAGFSGDRSNLQFTVGNGDQM